VAGSGDDDAVTRPAAPAVRRAEPPAEDERKFSADDRPGDPVCWLRLVCPECGSMAEAEPPVDCPQCGARIEAAR
jgi:rubrerythrin